MAKAKGLYAKVAHIPIFHTTVRGDKDSLPLKNKEAERRRCEYVTYIQQVLYQCQVSVIGVQVNRI
jgi:hypothetical protein